MVLQETKSNIALFILENANYKYIKNNHNIIGGYMINKSIWLDDYKDDNIEVLNKNIDVDVLIIGGGITGLTTLYNLRKSNLNVCLVEKDLIAHGVSGHTTAKINYLQETIYSDLRNKYSKDIAKLYLESQIDAIKEIVNIINSEKIKCNLDKVSSYIFADKKEDIEKIKQEKKLLEDFNINIKEDNSNNNLNSVYSIFVEDTYVFHPVKYLQALKKICLKHNKKIYEKTKVLNIKYEKEKFICELEKYHINAKKVIVACHYPFFLFPYLLPIKAYTEKSYITASLKNFENKTYITVTKPVKSERFHKDKKEYLIYLSNTSKTCDDLNEKQNYENVINESKALGLEPSYVWKNDDLITFDKLPFIGRIDNNNPNLLIGTGYNTWGMTNGTLAGIILSDLILDKKNKYENLCNSLRLKFIINFKEIATNINCSMKGFVENKLIKDKKWYSNNISFDSIDGKSIAIYQEKDKKYMVYNKCPHMGCSLVFNEFAKTWDCPCHASRFNIKGECIKGPSRYNITYKKEK